MFSGRKVFAVLVVSLLQLAMHSLGHAAVRTWTDMQGQQVQAEFVRLVGNEVVLKRSSGQVLKIPVATLSKADQAFIRTLLISEGVRVWTATDGRQVQAKYLRVRNGSVYVKMDGTNTSFPFAQLSIADRLFVRQRAKADGQAEELPRVSNEEDLPPARNWTSQDGQRAVGQFERILPDGRLLLAIEGMTRVVDVKQLSQEDHDYLRKSLQSQGLAHLVPPKPKPPEPAPEPDEPEPSKPEPPVAMPPLPPVPLPPTPQPSPRPAPHVRPAPHLVPPERQPAAVESAPLDISVGFGTAKVMISIGGLLSLAGVWWTGGIAMQNGDTVFGVLCFLCCGLAAIIYGFMDTEQCSMPLVLIFLGIGLQIIARVLVGF